MKYTNNQAAMNEIRRLNRESATKGVEDGIVCEFCGTHCYQGAEHNARVEDNARFDDPKPNGLSKIFGTWPGDETDAELLSALNEVRGKGQSPEELLAAQIVEIAVILGITKGDISLTGPHVLLLAADIKELLRLRAVPVEERTPRKTCYCNEIWCPTCYPPVPIAKPIPEERTAEMEDLHREIDEAILTTGTRKILHRLLDHIEGTPK